MAEAAIEVDPDSLQDEGAALDEFKPTPQKAAVSGAEVMMAGRRLTGAKGAGDTAVRGAMIGTSLAL